MAKPKTDRITLTVRLLPDINERLEKFIADSGMSKNAAIAFLISQSLPRPD